jgi:uncharacterized protein
LADLPVHDPVFLQPLHTDEYAPEPLRTQDRRAVASSRDRLRDAAARHHVEARRYSSGRTATAAGLLAINAEAGHDYYQVPAEAVEDAAAADAAFSGSTPVIDVQTHYLAPRAGRGHHAAVRRRIYEALMPTWWTELEDITAFTAAEYVRNVFLETENSVAVLTSGPGHDPDNRNLFNDEMAATKSLVDEYAGPGRLLNHVVVHANFREEYEAMEEWNDRYSPVGWKVYTHQEGLKSPTDSGPSMGSWMLDDQRFGQPFLEKARSLGVPLICVHKGISQVAENGSPRDIGPAARAFPDLSFVVYHSGYEFPDPVGKSPDEAEYSDLTASFGTNRLIRSAEECGIGPGQNIYPELGTTWFSLVRRPQAAAHFLGKMIKYFGADNVIWGTDSIWYGSAQPLIDAFRAFQIPDDMCEKFGYAPLTTEVKQKILGLNAARLYKIDLGLAQQYRWDNRADWADRLLRERLSGPFPLGR